MPFDARFNHLFRMAAKKPISEFLQGAHTGKAPEGVKDPRTGKSWTLSSTLHAKVKGGFCLGASLDWLRKVLQSEKKAVTHLKLSRVTRMAETHDRQRDLLKQTPWTPPSVAAIRREAGALESRAESLVQTSTSARDAFQRDVMRWVEANGGTWNGGQPRIRGTAQVINMFNEKMGQLNAMTDALETTIHTHNTLLDQADALRAQANLEVQKSTTAQKRAALWDMIANELGTDAGKKRKFSGIFPVASGAETKWATFKDYLVAILSAPAFTPGRGMLLSLKFKPEPGHAIALHRESSTSTLLFDANLGIYKFQDLKLLVHAMVILVELGYIGREDDGSVTELGDDHGWQIFCRTDSVLPAEGEEGLATAAEVMLAYDSARDTIEFSAQIARELMHDSLREAKRLSDVYKATQTSANHAAWVAAHNEATVAVAAASGDTNVAKTLYPEFTGRERTIT
jgi:hypothetical protein